PETRRLNLAEHVRADGRAEQPRVVPQARDREVLVGPAAGAVRGGDVVVDVNRRVREERQAADETLRLEAVLHLGGDVVRAARGGLAKRTVIRVQARRVEEPPAAVHGDPEVLQDRKSTRLNSSHANISY